MTSTSKHAFTAGPCSASPTYPEGDWVVHARGIPQQLAYLQASTQVDWPLEANANLIAEAFTVATETGLTPRQLAERCKELEAALRECRTSICGYAITDSSQFPDTLFRINNELQRIDKCARAALSKAQKGGV